MVLNLLFLFSELQKLNHGYEFIEMNLYKQQLLWNDKLNFFILFMIWFWISLTVSNDIHNKTKRFVTPP